MDVTDLSALFRVIDRRQVAKPAADEFDFDVDRGRRRVVGTFDLSRLDPTGSIERVRVQTGRLFACQGPVTLADTSVGALRRVKCQLDLRGAIPTSSSAARACLEAALREDFKFEPVLDRVLAEALEQQRLRLSGQFVPSLRDPTELRAVEKALVDALANKAIPIESATLKPIMPDSRVRIEIADRLGVEVRTAPNLELHQLAFKASLIWGKRPEQVVAQLAYRGALDDAGVSRVLPDPFVTGQTQPIGAWFRTLLVEATAKHTWEDILRGDPSVLQSIKDEMSEPLGRGTGRIIDTLILVPVVGASPEAEREFRFNGRYPINGLRGEGGLEVVHDVAYKLKDRDRWLAQGSPDAESFLKSRIQDGTRLFLQSRRYEDVVQLYLTRQAGESLIVAAIQQHVEPLAAAIGYELVSVATVLAIPEMAFVRGLKLALPELSFSLAEGHIAAPVLVSAEVKVGDREDDRALFSRATLMGASVEQQVRTAIEDNLRIIFRSHPAFDYYTSKYANGSELPTDVGVDGTGFSAGVENALAARLRAQFGLALANLQIQPINDPYVQRLAELMSLSIDCDINEIFNRGGNETQVQVTGSGLIYVESIDPGHWENFYPQVMRYDFSAHREEVKKPLLRAVRHLEGVIAGNSVAKLNTANLKRQIEDHVTEAIRRDCGLFVRVRLTLRVHRPSPGLRPDAKMNQLKLELQALWDSRTRMLTTLAEGGPNHVHEDDLKRLNGWISDKEIEISNTAKAEESAILRTETVLIGQADPGVSKKPRRNLPGSNPGS